MGNEVSVLQVLSVGGLAGVVSALVGYALAALQQRRASKKAAAHLALQLSALFDAFGDQCASAAADVVAFRDTSGAIGERYVPLPDLAEFPKELDAWRALDARLRNLAINFPNILSGTGQKMAFARDNTDDGHPDSFSDASLEANLRMARQSYDLATLLRLSYDWSAPTLVFPRDWIDREINVLDARKDAEPLLPAAS